MNRIVRIEVENKTYTVVWLDELNKPQMVRLKQEDAEAFQYLLPQVNRLYGTPTMFRRFLRSSIQKALVTRLRDQGDGGLTLDGDLMEAAGLLPNETVLCTNEHNGNQFLANLRRGRRGRGELILDGPVARQGMPGDRVTIDRYHSFSEEQMNGRNSKVLIIDMSIASSKHPFPTQVIDRADSALPSRKP